MMSVISVRPEGSSWAVEADQAEKKSCSPAGRRPRFAFTSKTGDRSHGSYARPKNWNGSDRHGGGLLAAVHATAPAPSCERPNGPACARTSEG